MTSDPLPCNVVVELLTDYLEGALDPSTTARVEEHLAECPPCTTYLAQMRATIDAVGHLPEDTLSEQAISDLEAAFRGFRHID